MGQHRPQPPLSLLTVQLILTCTILNLAAQQQRWSPSLHWWSSVFWLESASYVTEGGQKTSPHSTQQKSRCPWIIIHLHQRCRLCFLWPAVVAESSSFTGARWIVPMRWRTGYYLHAGLESVWSPSVPQRIWRSVSVTRKHHGWLDVTFVVCTFPRIWTCNLFLSTSQDT